MTPITKQTNESTGIKSWPEEERPREKLAKYGADHMTDSELLAILLRSGTRKISAVDLARNILKDNGGLAELGRMSIPSLKRIKGIGDAKAVTISAALQIGARFLEKNNRLNQIKASSSRDIADHFGPSLRLLNHEIFKILLLNTNNVVYKDLIISSGNLNASVVHAREIFKAAIDHLAGSIILMHNHPSGNSKPSKQDIIITENIVESGKIIGIPVLDHIIIGDSSYSSFADMGYI